MKSFLDHHERKLILMVQALFHQWLLKDKTRPYCTFHIRWNEGSDMIFKTSRNKTKNSRKIFSKLNFAHA